MQSIYKPWESAKRAMFAYSEPLIDWSLCSAYNWLLRVMWAGVSWLVMFGIRLEPGCWFFWDVGALGRIFRIGLRNYAGGLDILCLLISYSLTKNGREWASGPMLLCRKRVQDERGYRYASANVCDYCYHLGLVVQVQSNSVACFYLGC